MRSIEGDPNDEFDATIFQGFRNLLELYRSYQGFSLRPLAL